MSSWENQLVETGQHVGSRPAEAGKLRCREGQLAVHAAYRQHIGSGGMQARVRKDVELTEAGQWVDSTPSEMWCKLGTLRCLELAEAWQHAIGGNVQADNVVISGASRGQAASSQHAGRTLRYQETTARRDQSACKQASKGMAQAGSDDSMEEGSLAETGVC